MKKGYYFFPTYVKKSDKLVFTGVMNKIHMQVDELSCLYDVGFKIIYANSNWNSFKHKILNKLLISYSLDRDYDEIIDELTDPDFVYIRKVETDRKFIGFLKKIKMKFPRVRIIIEVPTYPYDKEVYTKLSSKISLLKDITYRKKLKSYVDRIVTYSLDDEIFGIKTIKIQNGINTSQFDIIKKRNIDNEIHLIAVARLQPYHGYERIIKGLSTYYKSAYNQKVIFYIVGDGKEESYLKKIAMEYGVNEYIIFAGHKTGDELTQIYNLADIGIGSFGFYKIGLDLASSLKTREYLARGLPVISGCRQDVFESSPCPYHFEFPNNESEVDISQIVSFYNDLLNNQSPQTLIENIRAYAEENVTMKKTFSPVITYLDDN